MNENKEYILSLIQNDYGLNEKQANDMYVRLWLFSHGIATMIATKTVGFDNREIGKMLMDVLTGLLQIIKKEN